LIPDAIQTQLHDVLGSQADSSRDINEYAQMLTQGDLTRTIYTENHDKASGQNAGQGRWPNIVDSSQPTSYIAQKLSTLGIATVFTAPGIPLIFYGQEFLDSQNFVFGNVPNLDWSQVFLPFSLPSSLFESGLCDLCDLCDLYGLTLLIE